jgi:hypothetical protein
VAVHSRVAYQDGSTATREVNLHIVSMDGFTPKPPTGARLVFGGQA